jgi:hypothetical protein
MTRSQGPYTPVRTGDEPGAVSTNAGLLKIQGPFKLANLRYLDPPTDTELDFMDTDERGLLLHRLGNHECWYVTVYFDGRRFLFRSADPDRAMLYAARWIVSERDSEQYP